MKILILTMLVGVCLCGLVVSDFIQNLHNYKPLCAVITEERDILDVLKQLQLNNFLSTLSVDQQLLLVDMVSHADAGTLTNFINTVGYSRILEILIALSADDERIFKNYVIQRLTLEAQGPINAHHGVASGHGQ